MRDRCARDSSDSWLKKVVEKIGDGDERYAANQAGVRQIS